jgi:hypothetical protein
MTTPNEVTRKLENQATHLDYHLYAFQDFRS